jgi:hypothetical protein
VLRAPSGAFFKITSDVPLPHLRDERRKLPLPGVDESQEGSGSQEGEIARHITSPVFPFVVPIVFPVVVPITTKASFHGFPADEGLANHDAVAKMWN